jgi:hypothetical protein
LARQWVDAAEQAGVNVSYVDVEERGETVAGLGSVQAQVRHQLFAEGWA